MPSGVRSMWNPMTTVELEYVAAQLIGAAIEMRTGKVSDRARCRDAIGSAPTNRLVNAIVDRIPNTSQEESWK